MHQLTQICKVTIAVFLTAMVAILFSTLTGCQSCTPNEEEVRWVPASRDTVPEIEVDTLETVEEVVVAKPVVKKAAPKKSSNKDDTYRYYGDDTYSRSWCDEFRLDSIQLTIIVSDVEMQITQSLN